MRRSVVISAAAMAAVMATAFLISAEVLVREKLLKKNEKIQNIEFARGTSVYFNESGKLQFACLGADQQVSGIPLAKGSSVYFYDNGKI
ncbi:MAG: hypothetical protein WCY23_07315, partial [Candidatus Omnitrophota bacterium]